MLHACRTCPSLRVDCRLARAPHLGKRLGRDTWAIGGRCNSKQTPTPLPIINLLGERLRPQQVEEELLLA